MKLVTPTTYLETSLSSNKALMLINFLFVTYWCPSVIEGDVHLISPKSRIHLSMRSPFIISMDHRKKGQKLVDKNKNKGLRMYHNRFEIKKEK
jgi:hypothetical protein